MSEAQPSVAVIVVNYNSAAFIDEFCSSLRGIDYPAWRLVAIDSASTDASMGTIERAFPGAEHIRCDENVGFAAGCNIGIARCLERRDDFVLFLNPDVAVTPGFLRSLVDAAANRRTIVVPKILYYYDHRIISTHAGGFDWRLGVFRHTYAAQPDGPATSHQRDNLDTASFCCALVPLQAFRAAGAPDERSLTYH